MKRFYIGLHQPSDAKHFDRCMVSINRLRDRKSDFEVGEWMMDSGAFTEVTTHGRFRDEPDVYADQVKRWANCGKMVAAASQDYMCEPFALAKTGLTVHEHQELTVDRYHALRIMIGGAAYLLPVLQGFEPHEYQRHVRMYGSSLAYGAWVGVGSVCKRNTDPESIAMVLQAVANVRPDLRLHGFGIKTTALQSGHVRSLLWSADSMAWSDDARRARRKGDLTRNQNSWREAKAFLERIQAKSAKEYQLPMMMCA